MAITKLLSLVVLPGVLELKCPSPPDEPSIPAEVPVEHFAVGRNHTCAVAGQGMRLRCWGENFVGQLGLMSTDDLGDDEPVFTADDVDLGFFGQIEQVVAGGYHTCARNVKGRVRCWGYHEFLGVLASEDIGDDEPPAAAPLVFLGYIKGKHRAAVDLAANAMGTCALFADGKMLCWGENSEGELGLGFKGELIGDDEAPASAPFVPLGSGASNVEGGGDHFCAITDQGNVRCWGQNYTGQLGYSHKSPIGDNDTPADAGDVDLGGDAIQQLALGNAHTCVLTRLGQIRCWGMNKYGQLGYGHVSDIGDDELPIAAGYVPVDAKRRAVQVAAGSVHTCAVLDDGGVKCWGFGFEGQLGYGNKDFIGDNETPLMAPDLNIGGVVRSVAMGQHACAWLGSMQLRCWGINAHGQLGYGHTSIIGDDEIPALSGDVLIY